VSAIDVVASLRVWPAARDLRQIPMRTRRADPAPRLGRHSNRLKGRLQTPLLKATSVSKQAAQRRSKPRILMPRCQAKQFFRSAKRGDAAGDVNARYGRDPGFSFYTHLSDQHGPYSTPLRRIIAYTSSHEAGAIPRPANLSPISVSHRRGPVHYFSLKARCSTAIKTAESHAKVSGDNEVDCKRPSLPTLPATG
jgi:hypothetical protein